MTASVDALLEHLAPAPAGSRSDRGRVWLEEHGLPTRNEEAWRYTPLDEVRGALDQATSAVPAEHHIGRSLVDDLVGDHGGPRVVFVNGLLDSRVSDLGTVSEGIWLGNRQGMHARAPSRRSIDDLPADGFHALNWAAGHDVAAVIASAGAHYAPPIHIVHLSLPSTVMTATHPRSVIVAGAMSTISVIETFVGLSGEYLTNASARLVLGDGANVTFNRIQDESARAIHIGRTAIDQEANSQLRVMSIMAGADIARSAVHVRLAGPHATAALHGLYVPVDKQRHDNVITVDHGASDCRSEQRFVGIVDDQARGSFSGHILVRSGMTGTDAHQTNRNLVLQPSAQADTRPWLEILADDVRCTHGATVGRLDDDAVFYLRSRGIPLAESRTMLTQAFANEVIDTIEPSSLRTRVSAMFAARGGR